MDWPVQLHLNSNLQTDTRIPGIGQTIRSTGNSKGSTLVLRRVRSALFSFSSLGHLLSAIQQQARAIV